MAEERLTVVYDGPDLSAGRMDVRDLAPALLGIADAVAATNAIVNPGSSRPGVAVSATNTGSFEVVLHVVEAGVLERTIDLLTGRETTAAVNLSGLVGVFLGGVGLVKKLHRRKIRRIDPPRQGEVIVAFDDGTEIRVPEHTVDVARDVLFREAAKKAVEPLDEGHVDSLMIAQSTESEVRVDAPDKPAFQVPEAEEEELPPSTSRRNLRLVNVAFTEGHKWRVTEGDEPFYVKVADMPFLQRVETNQEVFTAGDVLVVKLETKQWNTASGMRVEHTITEVLEHRPGPRQLPLPLAETDEDSGSQTI